MRDDNASIFIAKNDENDNVFLRVRKYTGIIAPWPESECAVEMGSGKHTFVGWTLLMGGWVVELRFINSTSCDFNI